MVPAQTNSDDIVARLRDNFLADARDRLETVDGLLDALRGSPGEED